MMPRVGGGEDRRPLTALPSSGGPATPGRTREERRGGMMDDRRCRRYGAAVRVLASALIVLGASSTPAAAGFEDEEDLAARSQPLSFSPDFAEPTARTRFHLSTRFMPANPGDIWTVEASGVIRVIEGAGVSFGVPFGWDRPDPSVVRDRDDLPFFGNVRIGGVGGHMIRLFDEWDDPVAPELSFGGALDLYIPTRPRVDGPDRCPFSPGPCDAVGVVGTTRPLEVGMYLAGAMAFRLRGHVSYEMKYLGASAELGLTPAFTLESTTRIYMWLSWALRVRGIFWDVVEPYVELGGAGRTFEPAAARFVTGPALITPGVRFHLGAISPAIFASFRITDADQIGDFMFGLDIGGAAPRSNRSRDNDMLDF